MPKLNLLYLDTHDVNTLAVADASFYESDFNIINPTLEITPPGFVVHTAPFTEKTIEVFNSNTTGITCDGCELAQLPDGIWKLKFSITPANVYYVEKTFLRTNQIYAKLDTIFLRMDFMTCDSQIKLEDKQTLDTIEFFIEGAIAAANNCLNKEAMNLYNKANKMLDELINHRNY